MKKAKEVMKPMPIAWDATVDWFTGTVKNKGLRDYVSKWAMNCIGEAAKQQDKYFIWESFGYKGFDYDGIKWGRREQDDLIQLKGDMAEKHWQELLPSCSNVSRIDLALTITYNMPQVTLAGEQYESIKLLSASLPIARNYTIITSLLGGDTLYVGKRSSSQFGRLYDKHAQSGDEHLANAWRWEVEFKKPLAWAVAVDLSAQSEPRMWIANQVKGWFEERLIEVPPLVDLVYNAIGIKRRKSTDEKALEWLYTQVRPSVTRLIERGKSKDVELALGLSTFEEN